MYYSDTHRARLARVDAWYAPARFGLFYHWGLFTGGMGATDRNRPNFGPLAHPTPDALEAAAGPPERVADNLVAAARRCGAKYATLTALHSGGGYCVIYPTRVPGFRTRTRADYLGAFIRAASAQGVRSLVYLPLDPLHALVAGGPWLDPDRINHPAFAGMIRALIDELAERHGDALGGIWLDGMAPEYRDLPAHIHRRLPRAVVVNNNNTTLDIPDVDYGTTEFLAGEPCPPYCRPSALREAEPRFLVSLPGSDFNEDIPTGNDWWDHGRADGGVYADDPHFLLRQMISSLGQRRKWNFAFGLGPLVDGTPPPEFRPALARVGDFLAWAGEAIYDTTGGEYAPVRSGYFCAPWSPQGFCSVTVSNRDPSTYYILVTTAPAVPDAMFHTAGAVPRRVTDLRTGRDVPFTMLAGVHVAGVDWSDVERYGAKVLKLEFSTSGESM